MGSILGALTHKDPVRRIATASAIAFVLWFGAWTVSYLVLSEGLLRDAMSSRVPDGILRSPDTLAQTIFAWNLAFGVGSIVIGSFFAIGPLSLGYFAPWWWALGYGVALGTNSFVLTVPGKIPPRIDMLWEHIGAPEILGYLLVAAALANIHMWRQRRIRDWKLAQVRRIADIRLQWSELACVAAAFAVLAWTARTEAAGVLAFIK